MEHTIQKSYTFSKTRIYKDQRTYQAGILGALGLSTRAIQNNTDLTAGQILYRLKKIGVKRQDYRNGQSSIAKYVLNKAKNYTRQQITEMVKEKLEIEN